MKRKIQRKDFIIRDLVVSVSGGTSCMNWLPEPDDEAPPMSIAPIASLIANMGIIESVRATVAEASRTKSGFEAIGLAFVRSETCGNPVIRSAIEQIGSAVVASVACSAMASRVGGLPIADCSESSLAAIPTAITPMVHIGRQAHRVSELPRLRQQLAIATEYIDKVIAAQAPSTEEMGALRDQLAGALKYLG